jgi:aspartate aminotransferase
MQLSDRVNSVKPSPTLAVTAKAAEMRAAGRDVIGLGAGEPDFDTPEHIKAAAIAAIHEGQTRYTAVDGTPALKKAVQAKFARENGLNYELNQILVSSGGKQSFYNLCQAYLDKGDEVIIPAPYWVSYPDMVLLADGVPVMVQAGIEQSFKITPDQLRKAITPRTAMLVLNSPSNPTGAIYSADELKALAAVLVEYPQILIASDDMYEHILLGDVPFTNILNVAPELKEQTIVMNGVSKAYSMTGWRIGYAAGPATIIKAMTKVQSQSTSNPCSVSQAAAVEALNGPQEFMNEMNTHFAARHRFVVDRLNAIPGVKAIESTGAFYTFANIEEVIVAKGFKDDLDFSAQLLEKGEVAIVPGSAFGLEGYMRLSFATSMSALEKALARIEAFIKG